jgi:hypothetical protein
MTFTKNKSLTIIISSIIIGILVSFTSYVGLTFPGFYSKETINWQAQCFGQDWVNLFVIVPCLFLTAILSFRKNFFALLWAGVIVYLVYTFIIYAFNVHYNRLFIIYCLILGLSVYSLIYFLMQRKELVEFEIKNSLSLKITGIFFLFIALSFYLLWLSELIPSMINNKIPDSIIKTGLVSNPVHVLDLSFVLPGIFIGGILLLRKKHSGYLLAPVILSFFILMDVTLVVLVIVMNKKGLESELTISYIMAILFIASIIMLVWNLRSMKFLNQFSA